MSIIYININNEYDLCSFMSRCYVLLVSLEVIPVGIYILSSITAYYLPKVSYLLVIPDTQYPWLQNISCHLVSNEIVLIYCKNQLYAVCTLSSEKLSNKPFAKNKIFVLSDRFVYSVIKSMQSIESINIMWNIPAYLAHYYKQCR